MRHTKLVQRSRFAYILFLTGCAIFSAQAATPLPPLADPNLQNCLSEQANGSGWQYVEQVVRLVCPGRNVTNLQGLEAFFNLAELDLSKNHIRDVAPLYPLHSLTKLYLSGNSGIPLTQLRPVLDMNQGLVSLGLNGIEVGSFMNLGALFNWQTGQPYALAELDLGNTKLTDFNGGKGLDFLLPFAGTLSRINVAGNGIDNIQVFQAWNQSGPGFANLNELNLSNNAIVDVNPLNALHNLTKLNLSGNRGIQLTQLRPVIDTNLGLTSLGLNGIEVGLFSNLGPLFNWQTGQPYALAELDLGNTNLTDPSGAKSLDFLVPFASTLTRLNVAGNRLDNILALWGWSTSFTNLSELDLANNAIVDANPLNALHNLTNLNLSGNRGIQLMQVRPVIDMNPGLTRLGLNGIEIGSISNLGPMFNWQTGQPYALAELDLGNTRLTDFNGGKSLDFLAPFAGTLSRINVAGNGIDNIQAFWAWSPNGPAFANLSELDLSNNAIVDVNPLSALHNLAKLSLSGNRGIQLTQLRPVIDMNSDLTSLGLNGIEVGSFTNLGPMFSWQRGQPYALAELDLGNTKLTDPNGGKALDFLAPFAGTLARLNVAGNGIDNIQAFQAWTPNGPGFANLHELDLSNNAIVDVNPLNALHNLTKLSLSGNRGVQLAQLRPVLDMNQGLASLGLNGIEVGPFNNLGPLFNWQTGHPYALAELDLGNTSLSDPSGGKSLNFLLPFAGTLARLNVAGNGIDNIQAFQAWTSNGPGFTNLHELDLSNNAIADVNPLYPLHGLTKLNLSGNRGIQMAQLRPVIDMNQGLASLGLNGIEIGSFSNLGPLVNWQSGRSLGLVELDLGNTNLSDINGGKSLDFLAPFAGTLARLNVAGNGIDNIQAFWAWSPNGPAFANLSELDLSSNAIVDVNPLSALHKLTKLSLSGNRRVQLMQLRPVIDTNLGLASLGLNGIEIGSFSNLGPMFNWKTGQPYALADLDLGNTKLTDFNGGKSLNFLTPFAGTLVRLNVAGNGIDNIQAFQAWTPNGPGFTNLHELDLSNNAIVDVNPLYPLHGLTKLNLSGNGGIQLTQLHPVIDMNQGLTSLGLNGIEVGPFSNLGPLFNWQKGRPYALAELDLGNTKLTDPSGGKSLDFLLPFAGTLSRINVAGNGIDNIQALWAWTPNGPGFTNLRDLDLSNNAIVDVNPLYPLRGLDRLNLYGNDWIRCFDLDNLAGALFQTQIQRPAMCQ